MEGKSFAENTKTAVENNTSQNALERYVEDEENESHVTQNEAKLKKYFALQELIELHNVPQETVDLWLQKAQVESIDKLPEEKIDACIDYIDKKFNSKNI